MEGKGERTGGGAGRGERQTIKLRMDECISATNSCQRKRGNEKKIGRGKKAMWVTKGSQTIEK